MTLPTFQADRHEQIAPGITLDWYFGERAYCLTLTDSRLQVVDVWYETALRLTIRWPTGQPFAALYDCSGVVPTPYLRERGAEIAVQLPAPLMGWVGLIVDDPISIGMVRLVFRLYAKPLIVYEAFYRRQAALTWLARRLGVVET